MSELLLIFVAGMLGSSHCVGMCGPLAIALGMPSPSLLCNLQRQMLFSIGRLNTYSFIGALAAFAGVWLGSWNCFGLSLQGVIALIGGVALIALGLTMAGVIPQLRFGWFARQPCAAAAGLKSLLRAPGPTAALLAGVFTGFIPCGLVYSFLAIAAASGSVTRGCLIMTSFGLGTIPLMVLTGCGATMLSIRSRAQVLRIAAWCVVVTGVISVARGAGDFRRGVGTSVSSCPFCHQTTAACTNE